ncbi:aminoglycoside N(3)-acetyltransferase [Clostridium beijerinckii]|uniref:aminoglycoside N(3)-acetyltransferase n=1 Tax=Clostridium beijerinckii TaxID=1520 RepID=UPI0008099D29|nr:AAC(3) family N-acetyltransferase [Clostridium beijerinckii]OCA97493.1 AAC(3) family N-acetyltransferase [Clostridium beijerinckii]
MGDRKIVIKKDIVNALQQLGVKSGQNIIVHTSMKSFGFACGGPQIIIEALIELVGKDGTIIMPTQTWKNMDPTYGVHWEEPIEWWDIIRDNWPAYDKDITPTNTMGSVAEMFRKWPGVLRSDHPVRSFAAWGKNAQYLINNHDLSDIFGESSPIGKLYDLDGYVLLLGTGYDKNTSIHLADERADYPSKHMEKNSCAMMKDGERKRVTYSTLYVDGEDFMDIGIDFEKKYRVKNTKIGNADVRFMRQREIVDFAVEWIEKNRK